MIDRNQCAILHHPPFSLTMSSLSFDGGWWWMYFDEHPGVVLKIEAAYANFKEK